MNEEKNIWKMYCILLGVLLIIFLISNFVINKKQAQEKEKIANDFMKFAQENNLTEICDLEQGICCNIITNKCYQEIKPTNNEK